MSKNTVLIIEDEPNICNFISTALTASDYKTINCQTGKEALALIPSHCPDVVLLDLGLPDMDGIEVVEKVRSWSGVPIIVVSARDDEKSKVLALDAGADDYITKPFGTSELKARIRAALRHSLRLETGKALPVTLFKNRDLTIDFNKHLIIVRGEEVHLTQIEYKLVTLLAQNAGKVLTYDYMISKIWGPFALKDNQILRVNMANIRRKLELNPVEPEYILTEIGVGYRMLEEEI
ncbi:DNA-binding response regulator [Anaerocolumna cellulosilytica]|uniref:Stage 0 sporulation protein A homolog n=2 Tax=Anaerocolumna cellulosilytica TaxID=433286 RepID=A0A6S6QR88_9FIRM|nr:response regulator [Anaerocolumna cellulosilytica]MBB5197990.1 two-component system KDP operon response regulator KdpE [Anaerocolumna cellulosilytica]BCJ93124.1 DNA-binding response regulator [Anaerocolumna cellulosilytica]